MSEKISKLLRSYADVSGNDYKQLKQTVRKMSSIERRKLYNNILQGSI